MIGPRRLDLLAFRIEAACASHKIMAHVHGGTASAHSAVFVMTFEPGHSLRQLMACKDDIQLSLGHPVLIHHTPWVRIRVLGVAT